MPRSEGTKLKKKLEGEKPAELVTVGIRDQIQHQRRNHPCGHGRITQKPSSPSISEEGRMDVSCKGLGIGISSVFDVEVWRVKTRQIFLAQRTFLSGASSSRCVFLADSVKDLCASGCGPVAESQRSGRNVRWYRL